MRAEMNPMEVSGDPVKEVSERGRQKGQMGKERWRHSRDSRVLWAQKGGGTGREAGRREGLEQRPRSAGAWPLGSQDRGPRGSRSHRTWDADVPRSHTQGWGSTWLWMSQGTPDTEDTQPETGRFCRSPQLHFRAGYRGSGVGCPPHPHKAQDSNPSPAEISTQEKEVKAVCQTRDRAHCRPSREPRYGGSRGVPRQGDRERFKMHRHAGDCYSAREKHAMLCSK